MDINVEINGGFQLVRELELFRFLCGKRKKIYKFLSRMNGPTWKATS